MPNAKFRATTRLFEALGLSRQGPKSAEELVAANIEFVYGYYARLARMLGKAGAMQLRASVDPAGSERLGAAVARGRGVLLASAHLGDFDLVGSYLAVALGMEVVVVSDRLAQRSRQTFFEAVRRRSGLVLRLREETRLSDLEADLRAGRVVLWMLDRRSPGPTMDVRLLGLTALMPAAVPYLARRTGCSLIAGLTTTDPDGTRLLHIGQDFSELAACESGEQALHELAQAVEAAISLAPWQWHIPADFQQLSITLMKSSEGGQSGSTDTRLVDGAMTERALPSAQVELAAGPAE